MKKLIIITVTLLLIWTGYSLKKDHNKLPKEPSQLTNFQQESDNLFLKKKSCGDYAETINKKLSNDYPSPYWYYSLDKIFYSSQLNSCLYAYHSWLITGASASDKNAATIDEYYILDYLTAEKLYSEKCTVMINGNDKDKEITNCENLKIEYTNKIKELEGTINND